MPLELSASNIATQYKQQIIVLAEIIFCAVAITN